MEGPHPSPIHLNFSRQIEYPDPSSGSKGRLIDTLGTSNEFSRRGVEGVDILPSLVPTSPLDSSVRHTDRLSSGVVRTILRVGGRCGGGDRPRGCSVR